MKHLKDINEFVNLPLTEQELLEMANITSEDTGIPNVVIWAGPNPASHGKRIKVSNIPNTFSGHDCFTITIPDLQIKGTVNKKFITTEILDRIMSWIKNNKEIIEQYSDKKISTRTFLDNLTK